MDKKEILNAIRREMRCPNCRKLIFKYKFWGNYSIQFVCPRCKNIVEINEIAKKSKQ